MSDLAVGDFVVYPSQGVGRVTALEQRRVAGQCTRFFLVRVLGTGADVLIPAEKVDRTGVRPIIDESRAASVLSVFDKPAPSTRGVSWIRRSRSYEQALSRGSIREVAAVLRDLHVMKLAGRLTFSQLRLFERSRRMIVYELAIALRQKPTRVARAIEERVRRANAPTGRQ